MQDVYGKCLLTAAEGAEILHVPVQADEPQQAFHKPRRLPQCHPKQHLHRQAGLDGRIAVLGLTTPPAGRLGCPDHLGVEPERRRLSAPI